MTQGILGRTLPCLKEQFLPYFLEKEQEIDIMGRDNWHRQERQQRFS